MPFNNIADFYNAYRQQNPGMTGGFAPAMNAGANAAGYAGQQLGYAPMYGQSPGYGGQNFNPGLMGAIQGFQGLGSQVRPPMYGQQPGTFTAGWGAQPNMAGPYSSQPLGSGFSNNMGQIGQQLGQLAGSVPQTMRYMGGSQFGS